MEQPDAPAPAAQATFRDCYRTSPTGPKATPWLTREVAVLLRSGGWEILARLGDLADQRLADELIKRHRKACGFSS